MENKTILVLLAVFCLVQSGVCAAAAQDAVLSPRDDSVDNYIMLVIQNFAAAMKTGIPFLGIPVLDPLNITKLNIPVIETGTLTLHANASDISVSGTSSFTPTYVHVDFETNKIFLDLHFLDIRTDGMYWCDGLLLVIFPVFGDGFFYIDIISTDSSGLGGIMVTDDDHLQITDLNLNLTFDRMDLYFDNFLGGGSFGEEMNEAIDALADSIIKAMIPLLNSALLPALVSYLNNALMEVTISDIINGILPGTPGPLLL